MIRTHLLACSIAAAIAAAPVHAQPASKSDIERAMAELTETNEAVEGGAIYAAVIFIAAVAGAFLLNEREDDTRVSP